MVHYSNELLGLEIAKNGSRYIPDLKVFLNKESWQKRGGVISSLLARGTSWTTGARQSAQ